MAAGIWQLLPLHIEMVLLGWTVQLAMGVAYWIAPRLPDRRGRGHPLPGWIAFALLNVGVLSAGLGQFIDNLTILAVLGRAAEFMAVGVFAVHLWPRIRPSAT